MGRHYTQSKKSNSVRLKAVGFVLGFVFLSTLAVFKSGWVDINDFKSKTVYDEALVSELSLKGSVRSAELDLSRKEIKQINIVVLRYRKDFPQVDVQLDRAGREATREVKGDTLLRMIVTLKVSNDCEMQSWGQRVTRNDLAPEMVASIERGASEFEHYRASLDKKGKFKFYY